MKKEANISQLKKVDSVYDFAVLLELQVSAKAMGLCHENWQDPQL